jgi:hypothetical protein
MSGMSISFRTADSFAAHAVCAAAGARDGLRAAQFYVRDLSRADDWGKTHAEGATFLSSLVARGARLADRFMTWTVNLAISLFVPHWRRLPSPFAPGMMSEVATAIRRNSFVQNPLFNAYFFRAAGQILQRYAEPPFLVLEHRVDAARRGLAHQETAQPEPDHTEFVARTLMKLVETGAVARVGKLKDPKGLLRNREPNLVVWSIACVTLLFAEEGKPTQTLDEDRFFAVVGALIEPRLDAMEAQIQRGDLKGLASELADIKAMY